MPKLLHKALRVICSVVYSFYEDHNPEDRKIVKENDTNKLNLLKLGRPVSAVKLKSAGKRSKGVDLFMNMSMTFWIMKPALNLKEMH